MGQYDAWMPWSWARASTLGLATVHQRGTGQQPTANTRQRVGGRTCPPRSALSAAHCCRLTLYRKSSVWHAWGASRGVLPTRTLESQQRHLSQHSLHGWHTQALGRGAHSPRVVPHTEVAQQSHVVPKAYGIEARTQARCDVVQLVHNCTRWPHDGWQDRGGLSGRG